MVDAPRRYFEDLVVGEVHESSTRIVNLEELSDFARHPGRDAKPE